MKPSGIEWIGDIPDDWEVRRLKAISKLQTGNTPSTNNKNNYAETGFPWLKPDDLCGTIKESQAKVFLSPAGKLETRILPANSILLCCIGSIGKIGFVSTECASNQQITALIIKHGFWRYFLYVLRIAEEELMSLSVGNVVFILNSERLGSLKIPFPPLKTQQKIADYLDEKCGEIDATIAKQKESIEKLKAYKQSLISETVTKGLDKSAPLKPSGIDYLGDIPDDWEVKRIKNTGKLIGGSAFPDEYQGVKNEEIPFIKVKSLAEDPISRNGKDSISESIRSKLNAEKFIIGSVVFAKVGAALLLQRFRILEFESCIDNNMMGFIPLVIEPRFFKYVTVLFDFSYFVNPGTVPSINQEQIGNIKIPFPPLKTQQKIADYLDSKCSQIDKYITEKQNIIQKLDAYKKSLIFECVTGKHYFI